MGKKEYSSPEFVFSKIQLCDVLVNSVINPYDPQVPTEIGSTGNTDDF